ncbi:MAG: phage tail tape measure protein, partial [Lachnospiraceae bacterium]|nr:phage tail tape measure protein [Lachnospiraceae bacterium]
DTEQLQEYAYAADLVDVSVDTMVGAMTKNIKSMTSAADGTKAAQEAYEELGISVTDANGELRNSQDVFWEIIDALGQIENPTKRDSIAMQLLGKSARDLNPLINVGSEGMAAFAEEAHNAGAVMSSDVLAGFGAFNDELMRMKSGVGAAKNALGGVLLPILNELSGDGVSLLNTFTNSMNESDGDASGLANAIALTLKQALMMAIEKLPTMLSFGKELLTALLGSVVESLPEILPMIVQMLTGLITSLVYEIENGTLIEDIVDAVLALFTAIADAVPVILPVILGAIPKIILGIVGKLTDPDTIEQIIDGAFKMLMAIVDAIPKFLIELIQALPQIINSILGMLGNKENFQKIIRGAIDLFMGIVKAIPDIVLALAEALPQIITSLITFFLDPDNFEMVLNGFLDLLWALITAIPTIVFELGKKLPDIIKGIKDGLSPLGDFFASIWNGLCDTFKGVGEWFKKHFDEAWQNIKKVFEPVGNFFEGVWKKITDIFGPIGTTIGNAVSNAFHSVLDGVIGWVEGAVNGVIGWINSIIDTINGLFGSNIGHLNTVKLTKTTHGGHGGALPSATEMSARSVAIDNGAAARWLSSQGYTISEDAQTTGTTQVGGTTNSFTQIINAPSSPSRAEIYRDTKKLLQLVG